MKSKTLQKWLGLGCATMLTLCSTAHAIPGASVKASCIGGACVANPTDSLAQIYNPAAPARTCQRFDLGATGQYWERDFVQAGIRYKGKREYGAWPEAGVTTCIADNISVGVAVGTWDLLKTDNQTTIDGIGNQGARWDYWAETVRGSLALRFNPCHALGVSVDYYYSRLQARGMAVVAGSVIAHGSTYSSGVGVTFGYLGQIIPGVSLGASYSPKVTMKKFDRVETLLATHRINMPPVYRVGLAVAPWECLPFTWATDVEYKQWDRVKSMSNTFNANPFGTDAGPGFAWRDQWIVKTGIEYGICDWFTARVGYRYESPLFKNNRFETYLNAVTLRTVQHYVTGGLTCEFCPGSELSIFGEYGFHQSINGIVPAGITGVAAGSPTKFKEKNFSLGFSYGQQF